MGLSKFDGSNTSILIYWFLEICSLKNIATLAARRGNESCIETNNYCRRIIGLRDVNRPHYVTGAILE